MTALSCADVGILHPLEDPGTWRLTRPFEPVAGMSQARRLNLALALIEGAELRAAAFMAYAAWDRRPCAPITNPREWVTTTALFRGLVAGLAAKRNRLAALDLVAQHLPGCPRAAGEPGCECDPRDAASRDDLWLLMTVRAGVRV